MKPTLSVIDLESLWIVATVLLEPIQKEVRQELNASRKRLDVKMLSGTFMRGSEKFKGMDGLCGD